MIDTMSWRKRAYCVLIFKVPTNPNSLWVNWIIHNKLSNKFFGTTETPSDAGWAWRAILKHIDITKYHIKYQIANGKHTLLWHDLYYGHAPLWNSH